MAKKFAGKIKCSRLNKEYRKFFGGSNPNLEVFVEFIKIEYSSSDTKLETEGIMCDEYNRIGNNKCGIDGRECTYRYWKSFR